MSEDAPKKVNTGLGHDDDGNIDDKRVAAWLTFAGLIFVGYQAVISQSAEALRLMEILIWPWMILMGATTAEKFKPGGKI